MLFSPPELRDASLAGQKRAPPRGLASTAVQGPAAQPTAMAEQGGGGGAALTAALQAERRRWQAQMDQLLEEIEVLREVRRLAGAVLAPAAPTQTPTCGHTF